MADESKKCVLCEVLATRRLLCERHEEERLTDASLARVMAGTGLTWSNVEEYEQEAWLARRGVVL